MIFFLLLFLALGIRYSRQVDCVQNKAIYRLEMGCWRFCGSIHSNHLTGIDY